MIPMCRQKRMTRQDLSWSLGLQFRVSGEAESPPEKYRKDERLASSERENQGLGSSTVFVLCLSRHCLGPARRLDSSAPPPKRFLKDLLPESKLGARQSGINVHWKFPLRKMLNVNRSVDQLRKLLPFGSKNAFVAN